MATLFTYRIVHDKGFAPNPYWGAMTLATCKPKIRLAAEVGDWIAAMGWKDTSRGVDLTLKVIFAMRVSEKLTLAEYADRARTQLKGKIPDMKHADERRHAGDAIFDFSSGRCIERPSLHSGSTDALRKDREGKYVLVSDHFYYFGSRPATLPYHLQEIAPSGFGRYVRSKMNAPFLDTFETWIESLGVHANKVLADPIHAPRKSGCIICTPESRIVKVKRPICQ
ncbi:MAG TPA: hypothetical protein VGL38_01535 [bacterium]|jgi:hypothetical protein